MEEHVVCYQFQCARYPKCARAAGMGCCLERDPQERELSDGVCTEELGYPYFQEKAERPVDAWMRRSGN